MQSTSSSDTLFSSTVLDQIADQLADTGYIILENVLDPILLTQLKNRALNLSDDKWKAAGIGRAKQFQRDTSIRSDKIHWLGDSDNNDIEACFLMQMNHVKQGLNQRLFMGLFDYESHFSIYAPNQFYQKHIDALKGSSNRVLSTVLYLNENWHCADGGELIIYQPDSNEVQELVVPSMGKMVIFLSEKFPHEVLAAHKTRYSIAGWFRVNNNQSGLIDPAN